MAAVTRTEDEVPEEASPPASRSSLPYLWHEMQVSDTANVVTGAPSVKDYSSLDVSLLDPLAGYLVGQPAGTVLLTKAPPSEPYDSSSKRTSATETSRPPRKRSRTDHSPVREDSIALIASSALDALNGAVLNQRLRERSCPWTRCRRQDIAAQEDRSEQKPAAASSEPPDGWLSSNADNPSPAAVELRPKPSEAPATADANIAAVEYRQPSRSVALRTDLLASLRDAGSGGKSRKPTLPAGWGALLDAVRSHGAGGAPDIIYLDPPYPNMSAERLERSRRHTERQRGPSTERAVASTQQTRENAYATVTDLYDLWALRAPLEALLGRGACARDAARGRDGGTSGDADAHGKRVLVAQWITNAPKVRRFVADKLWPQLGFRYAGEWAWCKITSGSVQAVPGAPAESGGKGKGKVDEEEMEIDPPALVVRPDHPERKPFEVLLLGWADAGGAAEGSASASSQSNQVNSKIKQRLLFSAPFGHSRKPAIQDLLAQLVHADRAAQAASEAGPASAGEEHAHHGPCLTAVELFARYTFSGALLHRRGGECDGAAAELQGDPASAGPQPEAGPATGKQQAAAPAKCACMYASVGDEPLKFNQVGVGVR